MKTMNPFLNSHDNKRYYTWNHYLKQRFHSKVFKVALNADFSCPNRDGTCGVGGCSFCGSLGSGEFAGDIKEDLSSQFLQVEKKMRQKWPLGISMPYFQAYSNTYAPLSKLQDTFDPFLRRDDIQAISIATRADCLNKENVQYFQSYCEKGKEVWMELGLQSVHDKTAIAINRGHTYKQFLDGLALLKDTDIKVCVHIINSLPYESKAMMLETANRLAHLPIHAVKIHMLHIMEDTQLAKQYRNHPFPVLSKEDYIDIVISQLELLPPHIIIQRLTGDGMKEHLITPQWTLKKVCVLNDIDKEMVKRNTWQGKAFR